MVCTFVQTRCGCNRPTFGVCTVHLCSRQTFLIFSKNAFEVPDTVFHRCVVMLRSWQLVCEVKSGKGAFLCFESYAWGLGNFMPPAFCFMSVGLNHLAWPLESWMFEMSTGLNSKPTVSSYAEALGSFHQASLDYQGLSSKFVHQELLHFFLFSRHKNGRLRCKRSWKCQGLKMS